MCSSFVTGTKAKAHSTQISRDAFGERGQRRGARSGSSKSEEAQAAQGETDHGGQRSERREGCAGEAER